MHHPFGGHPAHTHPMHLSLIGLEGCVPARAEPRRAAPGPARHPRRARLPRVTHHRSRRDSMATVDATSAKVQRMLAAGFNDVRLTQATGSRSRTAAARCSSRSATGARTRRASSRPSSTCGRRSAATSRSPRSSTSGPRPTARRATSAASASSPATTARRALVTFEHTLLGDFLDPMELETAVG